MEFYYVSNTGKDASYESIHPHVWFFQSTWILNRTSNIWFTFSADRIDMCMYRKSDNPVLIMIDEIYVYPKSEFH